MTTSRRSRFSSPTYHMLCRMGSALIGLGRYGEAENAFLQVTARSPHHDMANYRLAQIAVVNNRPKEATEAYLLSTYESSDRELKQELRADMTPILAPEEMRQLSEADRTPGSRR